MQIGLGVHSTPINLSPHSQTPAPLPFLTFWTDLIQNVTTFYIKILLLFAEKQFLIGENPI
jgi:hypothetical protein